MLKKPSDPYALVVYSWRNPSRGHKRSSLTHSSKGTSWLWHIQRSSQAWQPTSKIRPTCTDGPRHARDSSIHLAAAHKPPNWPCKSVFATTRWQRCPWPNPATTRASRVCDFTTVLWAFRSMGSGSSVKFRYVLGFTSRCGQVQSLDVAF
jgi:hypothetical protein